MRKRSQLTGEVGDGIAQFVAGASAFRLAAGGAVIATAVSSLAAEPAGEKDCGHISLTRPGVC
jgi:hypothetical protein